MPWLIGDTEHQRVPCPCCRRPCKFLGPAIELPPKQNRRAWLRLKLDVQRRRAAALRQKRVEEEQARQAIRKRIRVVESRPRTPGRARLVRQLRDQLEQELRSTDRSSWWWRPRAGVRS